VQRIFPTLVSTTSPTALTPNGTLTVNYTGLIAPMVKAVQALEQKITSLTATVASFADSFTTKKMQTDTLCVGGTCVSEEQLKALLQNANVSSQDSSSSEENSDDSNATTTENTEDSQQPSDDTASSTEQGN
jgi:hypothetical protein